MLASESDIEEIFKSLNTGNYKERSNAKKQIEKLTKKDKELLLQKIGKSDDPELKEIADSLSILVRKDEFYFPVFPKGTVLLYERRSISTDGNAIPNKVSYRQLTCEGIRSIEGVQYLKFKAYGINFYSRQDQSGTYTKLEDNKEFQLLKIPLKKGTNWKSEFSDSVTNYKVKDIGPYKLNGTVYKDAVFLNITSTLDETLTKMEVTIIKGIGTVQIKGDGVHEVLLKVYKPGEKIPKKYQVKPEGRLKNRPEKRPGIKKVFKDELEIK